MKNNLSFKERLFIFVLPVVLISGCLNESNTESELPDAVAIESVDEDYSAGEEILLPIEESKLFPSEERLSETLFTKKMVVAHNMTQMLHLNADDPMVSLSDHPTGLWDDYRTDNPATQSIGGRGQVMSYLNILKPNVRQTLNEAVEFEIRAAMELGLDGFQFFYPAQAAVSFIDKLDVIIKVYAQVIEENGFDFKIALALCDPTPRTTQEAAVKDIGTRIKNLIAATNNSDVWLRSPGGQLVTFIWLPYKIVYGEYTLPEVEKKTEALKKVAQRFYEIEAYSDEKIAYVYQVQAPDNTEYVNRVLDYFPAAWGWTSEIDNLDDEWKEVAKIMEARSRTYTQSAYPGSYTSKLFQVDDNGKVVKKVFGKTSNYDFDEIGIEHLKRYSRITMLSKAYRRHLTMAVDTDAKMINYISWNDYPEGHHLSPGVNTNFSRAVVLNYYKELWKTGKTIPGKDTAVVFYQKYPAGSVPLYHINLEYKSALDGVNASAEDIVEVVTMLTEPAEVYYNGSKIGDGVAGLNVHTAPLKIGQVKVEIKRTGVTIIDLEPPMQIVEKPYRTDRMVTGYSSEFEEYFSKLYSSFGGTFEHPETYSAP